VIEAVGTREAMMQAIRATRPGGHVGCVGVSPDVQLPRPDRVRLQPHHRPVNSEGDDQP
jgi:threonine dehydrogenase-like Zn-dependent dehydrogenase